MYETVSLQVSKGLRKTYHADLVADLTNFSTDRGVSTRARPSMLDLPAEVWEAMKENAKQCIVWPGQGIIQAALRARHVNERGEVADDIKAPTKAAILNAAIRFALREEPIFRHYMLGSVREAVHVDINGLLSKS
jgi:hypothetical protein